MPKRRRKKNRFPHCHWCGRQTTPPKKQHIPAGSTDYSRDHVVPQSMGGRITVACCFACNNLKGNMTPDQWRKFMADNPKWWKLWRAKHRYDNGS